MVASERAGSKNLRWPPTVDISPGEQISAWETRKLPHPCSTAQAAPVDPIRRCSKKHGWCSNLFGLFLKLSGFYTAR